MASILSLAHEISTAAQALEFFNLSGNDPVSATGMNGVNGHAPHEAAQTNGTDHCSAKSSWRDLPPDVEAQRCALEDATHKLQQRTRGPGAMIYEHLYRFTDIASWLFVCQFNIHSLVPPEGSISYADIGQKIHVQESVVRRYVENLMVSGFFEECPDRPGWIKHTSDSAVLVKEPKLLDTISMLHDEMLPSLMKSVEALKKWPMSQETNESGFCVANKTTDTMYQVLAKNPKKAQRFGAAMSTFTKESISDVHPLVEGFDWTSIDSDNGGTVVDLGGSLGHLSFEIARATQKIHFEVQDLPPTAEAGDKQCPSDMRDRCTFVAHDFLTPQKARGTSVDAFLIANTLQNWPDKYVLIILRNIIPAMRKGSKVLVYERPLGDSADTRWSHRVVRVADMLMGSLLNGMLRSPAQWKKLFEEADHRYRFVGVKPVGMDKGLAEAVFDE